MVIDGNVDEYATFVVGGTPERGPTKVGSSVGQGSWSPETVIDNGGVWVHGAVEDDDHDNDNVFVFVDVLRRFRRDDLRNADARTDAERDLLDVAIVLAVDDRLE